MARRSVWLGVLLATLGAAGTTRAQPALPPPAEPAPAVAPAPAQPLTSPLPDVLPPAGPTAPAPPTDAAGEPAVPCPPPAAGEEVCHLYLGTDGSEYLLWWLKSAPLPALVTRNRSGPPVLGKPGTRVLYGGTPADLGEHSGGRFTLGGAVGESKVVGMEVTYFFLGTRTTTFVADAVGGGSVGRPFVNALTGADAVFPVVGPSIQFGGVRVASSSRAQGIEANIVASLWHGDRSALNGLVGYRFLQVQEGVNIGQQGYLLPAAGGVGSMPFGLNDQFDAHNRFHGGQLGLRGDLIKGPVFVELIGKVAFGQTTEVVKAGGLTGLMPPGQPLTLLNGGLLALPSNTGRVVREAFAVLPEAGLKFGFQYKDHSRIFVGYNFVYLSDAVRPGDQIDRAVNPGQVPLLGGSAAFTGAERPLLALRSTDFWLQGLMLGLETWW
jgi:hypothetical protein